MLGIRTPTTARHEPGKNATRLTPRYNADMARRTSSRASFGRVCLKAASVWWNDNAMRLGASLSFYTVFAIAPVLLVAIAIAGLAFGPEAVRGELVGQMDGLVGREGALAIQALLEGASKRQASVDRQAPDRPLPRP